MAQITIVGLGPGAPELLTIEAQRLIESADEIWLRTRHHPIVQTFPDDLTIHTFDALYDASPDFASLYRQIASDVLSLAEERDHLLYGVPGSPWVGETTVGLIQNGARERDIVVRTVQGISFLEPTLTALQVDALPDLQIVDATALGGRHFPSFEPDRPTIIAQVYDRMTASDVKLLLMSLFPADYAVTRVDAAGTTDEHVVSLPLYTLDRSDAGEWGLLSSLYVPPYTEPSSMTAFMNIIAHLRSPDGCPWDREQDHKSLRPFLLEETYEVLAALDAGDAQELHEELGDLLLQIALHAQIASEFEEFTIADVLRTVSAKMLRRHPHVFGDIDVEDSSEVLQNWEAIKKEEKEANGDDADGLFDDVPQAVPALLRAAKIARRAEKRGWEPLSVERAVAAWQSEPSSYTLGTLLLSLAATARAHDIDAESALREAIADVVSAQTD